MSNCMQDNQGIVTKTEIKPSRVGTKRGYNFAVYYDNREYANFASALYSTPGNTG